ncbi:MAG: polysulfide reductase NrfD [Phycicoccus sp.]|nr:polysulfide reductase NrfD [Phycicoccus sp.]NMM34853.1 polysulfide reductase NrfD [Phycicoccus sp.]
MTTTHLTSDATTLSKDATTTAGDRTSSRNGTTARLRVMWYAVLCLLMLAGGIAFYFRMTEGLAVTNLTSTTPWGAWVAFYIFFVGLSAGAFLLSSLVYVFGMYQFERIGRAALLSAIVSMGVALAFIGIDLGRIDRSALPLVFFHWSSPLSWEVRFYIVYIVLLSAELAIAIRLHKGRSRSPIRAHRRLRILGTIGIPLAIFGVHGGTGTIFAVLKARGMWFGGLFPVIFVVSAMVSGTALLTVIHYVQRRGTGQRPDAGLMKGLATVLAGVLCVDLGLMFYEFVVPLLAFQAHDGEVIRVITLGPMWWSFWIIQLLVGMIIPVAVLLTPRLRARPGVVATAAALVVLGIVGVRFNIVVPPLIPGVLHGLPSGYYVPTLIEWVLSLGLIAGGAAAYSLFAEVQPIHDAEDRAEADAEAGAGAKAPEHTKEASA